MALTEIEDGMIIDGILTASKLNTTGTASSTTVLKGDFSWGSGAAASGKWNIADSAPGSPVAGDMWYASGVVYVALATADATFGAWSTGGNMTGARYAPMGAGTQTAGLCAGGYDASALSTTEEYNGNAWSAGGSFVGSARRPGGGNGTQSSAWMGGGGPNPGYQDSETYNGTAWSAANNMLVTRRQAAGAGTATAGFIFSGKANNSSFATSSEEFDGTSWTAGGSMSTGRNELSGCGILSSALATGGENPGSTYYQTLEEYNGTSWSAGGTMSSTGRKAAGMAGSNADGAIYAGGGNDSGSLALADQYDGTTWRVIPPLTIATGSGLGGVGSSTAGIMCGGYTSAAVNTTEEWTYSGKFFAKQVGYIK